MKGAVTLLLLVLLGWPAVTYGQDPPARVAEETRAALAAADREDWSAALAHLDEARKIAPRDPLTMLRLATVHDRAGHELAAICWYRAYLSVETDGEQVEQSRARIPVLEASVKAKAHKLTHLMRDAYLAVEKDKRPYRGVNELLRLYGRLDDYKTAVAIIAEGKRQRSGENAIRYEDQLKGEFARGQIMAGDLVGAEQMTGTIDDEFSRLLDWQAMIDAKIKEGDLAGAEELAARLRSDDPKQRSLADWNLNCQLAAGHARAGDFARAREFVARIAPWDAEENVDHYLSMRLDDFVDLGEDLARSGDLETARHVLSRVEEAKSKYREHWKGVRLRYEDGLRLEVFKGELAERNITAARQQAARIREQAELIRPVRDNAGELARVDDIDGAIRSLELLEGVELKSKYDHMALNYAMKHIAKAELRAGKLRDALQRAQGMSLVDDSRWGVYAEIVKAHIAAENVTEALALAREISADSYHFGFAISSVVRLQARLGDLEGARRTALSIVEGDYKSKWPAYSGIATEQMEAGDAAGALETARRIEDYQVRTQALNRLASSLHKAGDDEMAHEIFAEARETTKRIAKPLDRARALNSIAESHVKAGNAKLARETFAEARRYAEQIPEAKDRTMQLVQIAVTESGRSGVDGVGKKISEKLSSSEYQSLCVSLFYTHLQRGDLALAKEIAANHALSNYYWSQLVAKQFADGDVLAAEQTLTYILDNNCGESANDYMTLASRLADAGDVVGLRRIAETMAERAPYRSWRDQYISLAESQRRAGDQQGYDETLARARALKGVTPSSMQRKHPEATNWIDMATADYLPAFKTRKLAETLKSLDTENPAESYKILKQQTGYLLDGLKAIQQNTDYWVKVKQKAGNER